MIEVVSLFKERDTRDELGLGQIRNGFADLFFPGNAIMDIPCQKPIDLGKIFGHLTSYLNFGHLILECGISERKYRSNNGQNSQDDH